jgi:hypothetical protein
VLCIIHDEDTAHVHEDAVMPFKALVVTAKSPSAVAFFFSFAQEVFFASSKSAEAYLISSSRNCFSS